MEEKWSALYFAPFLSKMFSKIESHFGIFVFCSIFAQPLFFVLQKTRAGRFWPEARFLHVFFWVTHSILTST